MTAIGVTIGGVASLIDHGGARQFGRWAGLSGAFAAGLAATTLAPELLTPRS